MKNLILIRHAKAEADSVSGTDHDRAISASGRADALKVSTEAVNNLPSNLKIRSSSARRTTQTAAIFCKTFNISISEVDFDDALYTFDGRQLATIIRNTPNSIQNLLIFGHNEAITEIVNNFGNIKIDNVPTSGFVSISFDTDNWNNINNGKTIKTIFPRDLIK